MSRKFCGEHNQNFFLVRQTRNTRAEPVALVKPAGLLTGSGIGPRAKPLVGAVKTAAANRSRISEAVHASVH